MNERINELAEQAQKVVGYLDGGYTEIKALDQEKFAELIVREFAYDVMNLHGAKPERVQYAAKCWGVEV